MSLLLTQVQSLASDPVELLHYYLSYFMLIVLFHMTAVQSDVLTSLTLSLFVAVLQVSMCLDRIFHKPLRLGVLHQWLTYHNLDEYFILTRITAFWMTYILPLQVIVLLQCLMISPLSIVGYLCLTSSMFSVSVCFLFALLSSLMLANGYSTALAIILCLPFCMPLLLLSLLAISALLTHMPMTGLISVQALLMLLLVCLVPVVTRQVLRLTWVP